MTELERQKDEDLRKVGFELCERWLDGKLDFETFKSLFHRALAINGPGDEMEMFCYYARGEGWWDWMMQEIRKASQRVA